jgi:hypothetical protein
MTRVVFHIDRLVLGGVRHSDRRVIADAMQRELGRLMADSEVLHSWRVRGDEARVDAGRVGIASGAPAREIGVRVARGIAGVGKR